MEIYKINHISINQIGTQFCLSYNKGIKIYSLKNFELVSNSNDDDFILGEVLYSSMLYELSIVAFTGSDNNQKFHNRKLVLWDNSSKKVICSTQFKLPILSIKAVKKLIFVSTVEEVNICNFSDLNNYVEILSKVPFDSPEASFFEIWMRYRDNTSKYFLANSVKTNMIQVTTMFENCFEVDYVKSFSSGLTGVQILFYDEKLDVLFVVDSKGSNITGFSCINFTPVYFFYRGKSPACITSITSIDKKFLAVSNTNKTIHVFKLQSESSSMSYASRFYKLLTNPFQLNKSILKIRLDEISKDEAESEFYSSDYKNKGTKLIYNEIKGELICLGYHGIIYTMKVDCVKLSYVITNKFDWSQLNEIKNSQYAYEENCSLDLVCITPTQERNKNDGQEDNWKII